MVSGSSKWCDGGETWRLKQSPQPRGRDSSTAPLFSLQASKIAGAVSPPLAMSLCRAAQRSAARRAHFPFRKAFYIDRLSQTKNDVNRLCAVCRIRSADVTNRPIVRP